MVSYSDWELGIYDIRGKIDRGELIPDPDWQRGYIWKLKDEQLLIDSIIRGVPIPKVYLTVEYKAEKKVAVQKVVDGQQRLKAIHRFLNNKFHIKIKEKEYFFKDLDNAMQEIITTYKLNGHNLKDFTESDITFLFQRLNRTGIKLNNMEDWNAEFRGTNILAMAKQIGEEHLHYYINVIYTDENKRRMVPLDDLIDLCNCLIRDSVAAGRKKDLSSFLKNNKDISSTQSAKLKSKFRKVINNIRALLPKEELEESLFSKRTHFISLFLAIGLLISKWYILYESPHLKKDLKNFIENPPDPYRESALGAIRDKVKREQRVKMLQKVILKHSKLLDPERKFEDALKRKLLKIEPVCQICGKRITVLRSATVDHKVPWSKGGKTEEKNAQLAHKKCNAAKRDKEESFVII